MTPYVSIDIETTGLDPDQHQVLEIGAVFENWQEPVDQLPTFRVAIHHDQITGDPVALEMNKLLIDEIQRGGGVLPLDAMSQLDSWLGEQYILHYARSRNPMPKIVFAGKNFAKFDLQFLSRLPGWDALQNVSHRSIDPAMFYWSPYQDLELPGTNLCMERARIDRPVAHRAVDDSKGVIRLVRKHFEIAE